MISLYKSVPNTRVAKPGIANQIGVSRPKSTLSSQTREVRVESTVDRCTAEVNLVSVTENVLNIAMTIMKQSDSQIILGSSFIYLNAYDEFSR